MKRFQLLHFQRKQSQQIYEYPYPYRQEFNSTYFRGATTLLCVVIIASKHWNIQIVMCTPKILYCVKKRDIDVQLHKRWWFAFNLSATIQKKNKKGDTNRSRTRALTDGRQNLTISSRWQNADTANLKIFFYIHTCTSKSNIFCRWICRWSMGHK